MVKHIVTFKLKGTKEERADIARKFKSALEALPEQIEVLQSIEVGINENPAENWDVVLIACLLYTSPSPRDRTRSRMPSSA